AGVLAWIVALVATAGWEGPGRAVAPLAALAASALALVCVPAAGLVRALAAFVREVLSDIWPDLWILRRPPHSRVPERAGDVVWVWVDYVQPTSDAETGKDRPVVVLGRRGGCLTGVPLTTKDHTDRLEYIPVGSG